MGKNIHLKRKENSKGLITLILSAAQNRVGKIRCTLTSAPIGTSRFWAQ